MRPVTALRTVAAAAALLAGAAAAANPHDPRGDIGPAVGAPIPHDLTAKDQDGQERSFKALAHRRGLVILFTKSLDW